MNLWNVLLGSSAAQDAAEKNLLEWEDRVFQPVAGEDTNLAAHVAADIPRFQALNLRARFNQVRTDRRINGVLVLQLVGFSLVMAKLFGLLDPVLKLMSAL